MRAIETDITYVKPTIPPYIYKTMWDLLCNQLFLQAPPPGVTEDDTLPDVKVWNEGEITMTQTTSPYIFQIKFDTEVIPKASDIIFFEDKFYIIGSVWQVPAATVDTFICSGCILIDISIVGVYAALMTLNALASTAESARADAESARASAENGRATAEDGRVEAENRRESDYNNAEAERMVAYGEAEGTQEGSVAGDGSRWGSFRSAEAARDRVLINYVVSALAPWVVPGTVTVDNLFISDDESALAYGAKLRWDAGRATYLTNRDGRSEAIIADDGDYLYTTSGWKWQYSSEPSITI